MSTASAVLPINPGRGLGFLVLGGSLHDVFSKLKAQSATFPTLEVSYSSEDPIRTPIILELPQNGLRLRFDGEDQRLRLVEVLDLSKLQVTYKGTELVKAPGSSKEPSGPAFRQIYHKLFGPTFAGEYFPPSGSVSGGKGTYVLSYPGVAFSFAVQHSAWTPNGDFVSLLSSAATSSAHTLAIFNGGSWSEARQDWLTRPCTHPRSLAVSGRGRDGNADEVELLRISRSGEVEFVRRTAGPFTLILGETTPQDLVSQLGPPDAIYRKHDRKMSIHKNRTSSRSNHPPFAAGSPGQLDGYSDTDRSSTHTTDYSSPEDEAATEGLGMSSTECFYNYFNHGIDIFISHPTDHSVRSGDDGPASRFNPVANAGQLVATKLIAHGNVPGSYAFNRYRRCRWVLDCSANNHRDKRVTSESFYYEVSRSLEDTLHRDDLSDEELRAMRTPMVLNRDWGDSPASSFEFPDLRASSVHEPSLRGKTPSMGTTQLYGYPGLLFEVLRNDAISCLTVY